MSKSKKAARDRMAEILTYQNIQNTGPYSGQVGPEDPTAGDNAYYQGPGLHGMTGDTLEGAKLMPLPQDVDPYTEARPQGPYGYEAAPWPKGKQRR